MDPIRLTPSAEVPSPMPSIGSAALSVDPEAAVALRFRVHADGLEGLEALRHARRSMLREESTLGLSPGEPSLGEAVFSATEIVWVARPGQRELCLEKVRDLARRANRAWEELQDLKTVNVHR